MKSPKKKKQIDKRPGFFALLNPVKLVKEINHLGVGAFELTDYMKFLVSCILCMVVFCFVFKMDWPFIIILELVMMVFLPSIYYIFQRNKYEHKRFTEVAAYIEQLLYSFKRQPKILVALKDTAILFDEDNGRLRESIQKAIEYIQNGESEENIYKEAFAFIEDEFGCKRMYKVHEFLIRVESAGGVADEAIEMLVNDRNLWVSRIEALIQDKQKIRINVAIGIGLSLLIVGMSTYMLPPSFPIVTSFGSQVAKTIAFLMDMTIFYFVQSALSQSLLVVDQNTPFDELERSYNIVMHNSGKAKKKTFYLVSLMFFALSVILFFTKNVKIAMVIALFSLLIGTQPKRQYKACYKRIKREVEKTFPDWLLSLALQLQTDNVHVSIAKTSMDAPRLLMEELAIFQDDIEKHPNDLKPYTNFFKRLEIPDVLTAMKMIYAMSEFGAKDSQEQIRSLVNRNTDAMDKADRMRMEDSLAGISFAMLLPMITGVIPMLTDLALLFTYVLSQVNA